MPDELLAQWMAAPDSTHDTEADYARRVPSIVNSLFAAAGAKRDGVVGWSQALPGPPGRPGTGVYVIALTPKPHTLAGVIATSPLSAGAVQDLLDARTELTLDGVRPRVDQLATRLAGFWCPDEVVLYIGRAGPRQRVSVSELADRVEEYYTTPLGARSPHAGGWPLKTLTNLDALHVHYAYCADDRTAEERMLDRFAEELSEDTREALHDSTFVMPFANLEDGYKRRKLHGIRGARAPRRADGGMPARRVPRTSRAVPPIAMPAGDGDMSAPELSRRLGANPKTLRAWLRSQASAGNPLVAGHERYGRWWFTEAEAKQLADQYQQRR